MRRSRPGRSAQIVATAIVRALFRILFHPRIEGRPPRRGPYIVVANHQGWADAFLLLALFPKTPRLVFLADKDGTLGSWWHRAILRPINVVIPIDRQARSDRHAIGAALAALRDGDALVIFAEGQVSHAENALASFRRGTGYLALRSGAPVLPVWIGGTAELYLGRELLVRVGTPRAPGEAAPSKEATLALAERVEQDVRALEQAWIDAPCAAKRWRWLTDIL